MSTRYKRKGRLKIAPTAGRRREAMAIIEERPGKSGEIMCPFCFPRHPLLVGQAAPCGTVLELKAVQRLYVGVTCIKCGDSKGTLIRNGVNYEHAHDCAPGKILLPTDPVPSTSARLAMMMGGPVRSWMERRRGAVAAKLTNNEGRVLYSWMKT